MTKKEIKKRIDESESNIFTKADLYSLFEITGKVTVTIPLTNNVDELMDLLRPAKKHDKKLTVEYKGSTIVLNSRLLDRQKAWDNVDEIKSLHLEKLKVFEKMNLTDVKEDLRKSAQEIEQLEFKLQKAWGFPQDRNCHYWYDVPKCTCPKMDNRDNYGTEYRITDLYCPIHGDE